MFASASDHMLSNERKQKELQDLQEGKVSEEWEWKEEWRAKKLKAVLEERATMGGIGEVPVKVPRNSRVSSLEELPPSFTAEKDVLYMEYCVRLIFAAYLVRTTNSTSSGTFGHLTTRTLCPRRQSSLQRN
jgi:hypothetical protein